MARAILKASFVFLFVLGSLTCSLMAESAEAQGNQRGPRSDGTGFDWIGLNRFAAWNGAVCERSWGTTTDTDNFAAATSWTPPVQTGITSYSPTGFRAIVGLIPGPQYGNPTVPYTPDLLVDYSVRIYPSLDAFRLDPNRWVASYEFPRPMNPAVQSFSPVLGATGQPQSCSYLDYPCRPGVSCSHSIPCYYAQFDLVRAPVARYKTSQGVVTTVPFQFSPGVNYWIVLEGQNLLGVPAPDTAYPCVAWSAPWADSLYLSPWRGVPGTRIPMTTAQCADSELPIYPPGSGQCAGFPPAHGEISRVLPGTFGNSCNSNFSYVNYVSTISPPGFEPYWNYLGSPSAPYRTFGWPYATPGCLRTLPGYLGYALTVRPNYRTITTKLERSAMISAAEAIPDY